MEDFRNFKTISNEYYDQLISDSLELEELKKGKSV